MAKHSNWFGDIPVKHTTARLVRFGQVAQGLVPGSATVLDAVYLEGRRAVSEKAAEPVVSDFVLRLVKE